MLAFRITKQNQFSFWSKLAVTVFMYCLKFRMLISKAGSSSPFERFVQYSFLFYLHLSVHSIVIIGWSGTFDVAIKKYYEGLICHFLFLVKNIWRKALILNEYKRNGCLLKKKQATFREWFNWNPYSCKHLILLRCWHFHYICRNGISLDSLTDLWMINNLRRP